MFGAPGVIYVYAAYGMYPCLNVVTGPLGEPSAVLVRGVWLDGDMLPTLGPGKTTRALGVTLADHGSRIGERVHISAERRLLEITASTRVGITRGADTPWRFIAANTSNRDGRTDGYSQAH
jgi:DNA-3-methyladenine glycosylase